MDHRDTPTLEAALAEIRRSPTDTGAVALVVARPHPARREVLDVGELDPTLGLVGDTWHIRPCRRSTDGGPHPDMQLTLVNARFMEALAGDRRHWPPAGDQIYVDFDLGVANLEAGSRLRLGSAVIEITDQPHTGCPKFSARFGKEALAFVNSPAGIELRLRGIYAKVVRAGSVRPGDQIAKLGAE